MIQIHPIRTGSVRIRQSQRVRKPGGLLRVLFDTEWSEWLPIYAWAVEHAEGVIVVDTGETARASEPGYFPQWHPYYRRCVEMDVSPDQEIGPQLRHKGIDPDDVRTVVLTHLHTDHVGGLHHFPSSRILVSGSDYRLASGTVGKLFGYLPQCWPSWFDPEPISFTNEPFGPFPRSSFLTEAKDVVVVPTPGHTPSHLSVIVLIDGLSFFLAGDTSYTQRSVRWRIPDGIGLVSGTMRKTHERILMYAVEHPTVYLPSHDPESEQRLREKDVLPAAPGPGEDEP